MSQQFFHDLFSGAHGTAAQQNAEFNKKRDEDEGMYQQVLHDPASSTEQRQRAATEIGKLRNLNKKDNPYLKVADVLSTIGDHIKGRQQTTQAPPKSVPGADGTSRPADLPPITAEGPRASLGRTVLGTAVKGLGAAVEVGGGLLGGGGRSNNISDLPPIDVKAFPTAEQHIGKKTGQYKGSDGRMRTQWTRPDGSQYETTAEGETFNTARPVKIGETSMADAQGLAQSGASFLGQDGEPIDLSQLPKDMALLQVRQGDKSFYVPYSPAQKKVVIGNKAYSVTQFNLSELPTGGGTELGVQTPGTTTDTTNHLYGKESTRTPAAPGVPQKGTGVTGSGGGSAAGAGGDQPAVPSGLTPLSGANANGKGNDATGRPQGASSGPGRGKPVAGAQKPAGGARKSLSGDPSAPAHAVTADGKLGPPIPNMQLQKQANAINEARNSLVGDTPGQLGGIAGDLTVFNNPESVRKLSEYIGFINTNLDDSGKDVTGKGIWAAVDWYAGLPRAVENLKQAALRKAGAPLNPEEEKFIADYYRLMGTIGGMRAATGASAAKWNFTNLRGEMPTPGVVTKYGDAVNRLRNFTRESNVVGKYNPLIQPVDESMLDQLEAGAGSGGSGGAIELIRGKDGKLMRAPKTTKTKDLAGKPN